MSRYRKAIAAVVVPLLSLPLAGWISGEVPFNASIAAGAGIAALNALAVYFFKNDPPTDA